MNDEMSFESIFNMGVGVTSVANDVNTASVERFDGDLDSVFADAYKSEEKLEYLDKFDTVQNYNSTAKLRMLRAINSNYGKCNRGIENYVQSLEEAETEGTSAKKEPGQYEKIWKGDGKKFEATWKHAKWLQTALHAVATFFKKIWETIKLFFKNLATKIKNFFTKKKLKKDAENTAKNIDDVENYKKFINVIDIVSKSIDQFQSTVNKVNDAAEKATKDLSNHQTIQNEDGTIDYDNYTLATAALKLLTSLGKIVLKCGQAITSLVNSSGSIKKISQNKFTEFLGKYKENCDRAINLFVNIQKSKNSYANDSDYREPFNIYSSVSNMVKTYIGLNRTQLALTSSEKDPKKIKEAFDKLTSGINESVGDMTVIKKKVLVTVFGIEVDTVHFGEKIPDGLDKEIERNRKKTQARDKKILNKK